MLDHSEERDDMKRSYCSRIPSFPEICEQINYIWIQTELSNPHYVASCAIAIAFSTVCKSACVLPFALLYNKCCIYSPGEEWCNSQCEWFPVRRINAIDLSSVTSCFNYKPYFYSDESSLTTCALKWRMKEKEEHL